MVARGVFVDEDFDSSQVSTIITLATPHQYPVLAIDESIALFYKKVNDFWLKSSNTILANVVVASIGGSNRDIQVRSGLTPTPFESSVNVLVGQLC